ncbi:MAG: LysR family transcriptional regulator [Xenococcaceae cyanobacterium MO_188.B29]|nr:LysR family transcriptional regulator [Xenococcaceae cyanobacterium MO_188.B29]
MNKYSHLGIKLSQLRAFLAVAEYGNFGEAAIQLGLTQPSISHAIATLEEVLGVVLLIRGRHGAKLTPVGEKILIHLQEIFRSLDAVIEEANLHKGLEGGKVRIATFRSAAAYLLPSIMARFRKHFPAIDITITEYYDYTLVEQSLREGKADIGFTFLPTSEELETVEVLRDKYLILLPPNSDYTGKKLSWQELTSLPLITFSSDNSCFLNIYNFFLQAGYSLKPRYQFRESSTILNMVAQGLGVAIVPQLAATSIPEGIKVCQLPEPLERVIGVAIVADSLQSPAVFACLDVIKQMKPLEFFPKSKILV